jgi:hypothetical protein
MHTLDPIFQQPATFNTLMHFPWKHYPLKTLSLGNDITDHRDAGPIFSTPPHGKQLANLTSLNYNYYSTECCKLAAFWSTALVICVSSYNRVEMS